MVDSFPFMKSRGNIPAEQWTVSHIQELFTEIGPAFASFCGAVEENGVDGKTFLSFDENDLLELGLTNLQCKRMLKEIATLKSSPADLVPTQRYASPAPHDSKFAMHISYSREDSELLAKVQSAVARAHGSVTGVMTNQGDDWFSAWHVLLVKAHGVIVFFTEGDVDKLDNHGVGYKEKLASRFKSHGEKAALYREAQAILELKRLKPDFKIYVVDGIKYLPEQVSFNLMDNAPSFGPVRAWREFIEGGCVWECKYTSPTSKATLAMIPSLNGRWVKSATSVNPEKPIAIRAGRWTFADNPRFRDDNEWWALNKDLPVLNIKEDKIHTNGWFADASGLQKVPQVLVFSKDNGTDENGIGGEVLTWTRVSPNGGHV